MRDRFARISARRAPEASDSVAMARPAISGTVPALGLSALGAVFGDISTSPLYTRKTVLGLTGGTPDRATTLGLLSLVVWTLIIVTTQVEAESRCVTTIAVLLRRQLDSVSRKHYWYLKKTQISSQTKK